MLPAWQILICSPALPASLQVMPAAALDCMMSCLQTPVSRPNSLQHLPNHCCSNDRMDCWPGTYSDAAIAGRQGQSLGRRL